MMNVLNILFMYKKSICTTIISLSYKNTIYNLSLILTFFRPSIATFAIHIEFFLAFYGILC